MNTAPLRQEMASRSDENLCCPICYHVYKDPVLLSCNHSFCVSCLQGWWSRKEERQCPVCELVFESRHPPPNLALKNLCEAFLLERDQSPERFCRLHSEELKLFCVDHQEPVCLICRDSDKHPDHTFKPIDEVVQSFREELQESLEQMKEKLEIFNQAQENYKETERHIKLQAHRTKKEIRKEFKRIRELLDEQEKVRVAAVKEEKKSKVEVMKKMITSLRREKAALSDTIKATKEELRNEDVSFLKSYKAAVERVQQLPPLPADPQPPSGALLDEAQHLGNLRFNIWSNMEASYRRVILDPNTAHPGLELSEDLTSIRWGESRELPDNPERFDSSCIVLSSKGFRLGLHIWDVEVGDSQHWVLGVASESVQRKGQLDPQSGLWAIGFDQGQYKAFSPYDSIKVLPLEPPLQKIRVSLDCILETIKIHGSVFPNAHFPNAHFPIHTFDIFYGPKVFPFIGTRDKHLLKILPDSISLTNNTQQQDQSWVEASDMASDKDGYSDDYCDTDDSSPFWPRFGEDNISVIENQIYIDRNY